VEQNCRLGNVIICIVCIKTADKEMDVNDCISKKRGLIAE